MLIAEPFIAVDSVPMNFWNHLNLKPFAVNNRNNILPNIWAFCNPSYDPVILASSRQHISFSIVHENCNLNISAVYAFTSHILRRDLWLELSSLQQSYPGPWLFLGDFNVVLGAYEKRGGFLPPRLSCEEFRAWSDTCNLNHVQTRGAEFTWTNNRSARSHTELRLDRAICNDEWLNFWSSMTCCTLTRCCSDHFPLLINLSNACKSHPSSSPSLCGIIIRIAADW